MTTELPSNLHWERETLEKLLFLSLKEQRRRRRWGVFFKLLFAGYVLWLLVALWPHGTGLLGSSKTRLHTSLVDINGVIDANEAANADNIIFGLRNAFQDKSTLAVVLRINSPGGSPVQAAQVYNEIRYLRARHPKTKLYAVCDDLCVSAAYYIAAASEAIYASSASLVGSIGVLVDSFGFVNTLEKLGMERRLLTSGRHKAFLDPFSPLKPADTKVAQSLIDDIHQQFIQAVKQGRGHRLRKGPELFSGLAWTGQQALPLGLIDGLGDLNTVTRLVVKNDSIVDYTIKPSLFQPLLDYIGVHFAQRVKTIFGAMVSGFIR